VKVAAPSSRWQVPVRCVETFWYSAMLPEAVTEAGSDSLGVGSDGVGVDGCAGVVGAAVVALTVGCGLVGAVVGADVVGGGQQPPSEAGRSRHPDGRPGRQVRTHSLMLDPGRPWRRGDAPAGSRSGWS
jgi:hypothetical protein